MPCCTSLLAKHAHLICQILPQECLSCYRAPRAKVLLTGSRMHPCAVSAMLISLDARQNCLVHLQCHFTRSPDMSTFLEDMRLIRPTEMLAPPRITSMMFDHFQEVLGAKSASSSPEDRERQRQASPAFTEPVDFPRVHGWKLSSSILCQLSEGLHCFYTGCRHYVCTPDSA